MNHRERIRGELEVYDDDVQADGETMKGVGGDIDV
jgi:hypothetical protein